MSKDKYSLKSLSKERLIDIIASLEWEINYWKEKEDNSIYFEKQVIEKDKEIKQLKSALEYNENNIPNQRKAIRHQVCEEIRHEIQTYLRKNNLLKLELVFGIDFIVKQIEKGESGK